MTTYNLTDGNDTINGGLGTDIFQGPSANSTDELRGYGGNDLFFIQEGQQGVINGGSGRDLLHLVGNIHNQLSANLTIVGVEDLIVDSTNLYATARQLKDFTHYGINNSSDQFSLFLQGLGGTLDFSDSFTEPQRLNIEAEMADSAVNITGSAGVNFMLGSDYSDKLKGDLGNDSVYGAAGNDEVSGGRGRDYIYGDAGNDYFLFDAPAGTVNFDHIGDFRPNEDAIRLDDAAFAWSGQTGGVIKATEFKIIGGGTGGVVDASDRIIYNQDTGYLYFDRDGSGNAAAALPIAVLDNFAGDIPVITRADIFIV